MPEIKNDSKLLPEDDYIHNSFFDYDAYDAQVFHLPQIQDTRYFFLFLYK